MRRTLLFYTGSGISGAFVRAWTRSGFAHVAVRVGDEVFEAVWTGVRVRPYEPLGRDRGSVAVLLPAVCWAQNVRLTGDLFLNHQVGKPYDWQAVWFDLLGVLLGPRARLNIAGEGCWDCSRLAAAALGAWGWQCADLSALHGPVSPGDLFRIIEKDSELNCTTGASEE